MAQKSVDCPDPAELSAFFEGKLGDAERSALVAHASGCADCRAALGALDKMRASRLPVVPTTLLEAARHPARRSWRPAAAALVAAACVLVAVSVSRRAPEHPSDVISTPAALPSERPDDVRARAGREVPQLMAPEVGAVLSSSTRFQWTPVAGAVQYQLHVLTGDGDVVFDATTAETAIDFAGAPERQGPFYAWVAAQLTDGRRVQSAVVRLAGPTR